MQIPEDGTLLRIFVGDSDHRAGKPLYEAIVLKARELHLAGATVFRGIMGYGRHSRIHTTKWEALSTDLPVVVEIVDAEEKIGAFLPHVDEMVQEGLVTLEKVRVLKYASREAGGSAMKHLAPYLWVGVGGFLGANVRYIVANAAQRLLGIGFPYGTFFINVSGSFLLGVVLAALGERALPLSNEIRLAAAVGFLGAYTTFSTFEYECHALLEDGEWALALVNIFGSLFLGLTALRLGIVVARQWS